MKGDSLLTSSRDLSLPSGRIKRVNRKLYEGGNHQWERSEVTASVKPRYLGRYEVVIEVIEIRDRREPHISRMCYKKTPSSYFASAIPQRSTSVIVLKLSTQRYLIHHLISLGRLPDTLVLPGDTLIVQRSLRLRGNRLIRVVSRAVGEEVVDEHADDGEEEDDEGPEDFVGHGAVALEDLNCSTNTSASAFQRRASPQGGRNMAGRTYSTQ
jgi:hypothetical protein